MSEFLKRPTIAETDEDLLKMQEQWTQSQNQKKPSVEIHRVKKRGKVEKQNEEPVKNQNLNLKMSKTSREQAARFQIDLDDIREESNVNDVLFGVRELNIDWLHEDKHDEILKSATSASTFSKDDGFPETLDLSAYYTGVRAAPSPGVSFFAAEFDRIHGNLAENLDEQAEKEPEPEEASSSSRDFRTENEKYLNGLDAEKIAELRSEIEERFDPKLLEFLANRGKKKEKEGVEEPKKVSKFKQRRQMEKLESAKEPAGQKKEPVEKKSEEPVTKEVEEMINELEVLEEWSNREDQEKYNRLATDAIQMDLAAKSSRNLAGRQQKNAVRLFEICKQKVDPDSPSDDLVDLARASIDKIKPLYLEQFSVDGQISYEYGKGVNPIVDECWTLVPVRRVLDAVEKRQGVVLRDDIEIVRLALLWTNLLFTEWKTAFFASAQPNEFYVHLAETYLIGSEVLGDDMIAELAHRVMMGYVLPAARDGKICLRMTGRIAGLDAFMPFYENLLKNYEQYSLGDARFTAAILIAAYLNAPMGDSIEYRCALWAAGRNTVRQITARHTDDSSCRELLDAIKTQISERDEDRFEGYFLQYHTLLGLYVRAIRDEVVTRDRNPLMFEIAACEIGTFLKRAKEVKMPNAEMAADVIRQAIAGKITF